MKLNMEQRRIVELEPGGPMLVKGVAGSGNEYLPLISFDHIAPTPFEPAVLAMWHKGRSFRLKT